MVTVWGPKGNGKWRGPGPGQDLPVLRRLGSMGTAACPQRHSFCSGWGV